MSMTHKRKLYYMLCSGKNSKMKFFAKAYLQQCIPSWITQRMLKSKWKQLEKRDDREEIIRRARYYCKLSSETQYDHEVFRNLSISIKEQSVIHPKAYYFDAMAIARYFDSHLRWILKPGDVADLQALPTILKSRPISDDNQCSVLLNLNKVRHFLFVDDHKPWREKRDVAIFRGDVGNPKDGNVKPNRMVFMNRWFGHPMVDAASIDCIDDHPEWQKEKMTIGEHLDYKFVMSLEGNDVASNLKWVMSSNSIAVTPRLTCETWFMEGTLIPNYHYIEVKSDFSDLEERLHYYIDHPDEAEAIIQHAHEFVAQFQDKKREELISLLVLKKYFEITNSAL